MSEPTTPPMQPIVVAADARLKVLLDRYRETKAEAAEAEKRAKDAAAELKVALVTDNPGSNALVLVGHGSPVNLTYIESSHLDTKKLRERLGPLLDEYTKTSGSWTLREDK